MTAHPAEVSPLLRSDRCLSENRCVATLTLNRPAKFNALSEELLTAIQVELDDIAQSETVQVVVIAAAGKAFCAGHDLKQMRETPDEAYYQTLFAQCGRMMQTLTRLPQPVVAKVQGMATAAGCQLVAACDLAVAASDVQFAVSGVNLGLFCSTPSVALSRNVSRKRAFEMLVTGDFIDTEKAKDWGLINDAVDAAQLDNRVDELVDKILHKPPVAIRTGKTMFYRQLSEQLDSAYQYAGDVMAGNMMAEDTIEGIDAFIGKRPPNWRDS
ncbi:MAG: enoyl-CoA hydratase [Gammaproteobacteria bacterium]|nr:enoyl-CoA hydratase [Gammaproteobacteria bacterium]